MRKFSIFASVVACVALAFVSVRGQDAGNPKVGPAPMTKAMSDEIFTLVTVDLRDGTKWEPASKTLANKHGLNCLACLQSVQAISTDATYKLRCGRIIAGIELSYKEGNPAGTFIFKKVAE